jgi:hypothetical protein
MGGARRRAWTKNRENNPMQSRVSRLAALARRLIRRTSREAIARRRIGGKKKGPLE